MRVEGIFLLQCIKRKLVIRQYRARLMRLYRKLDITPIQQRGFVEYADTPRAPLGILIQGDVYIQKERHKLDAWKMEYDLMGLFL
jgi:predicted DNA-binding transcriptional regulator